VTNGFGTWDALWHFWKKHHSQIECAFGVPTKKLHLQIGS